MNKNIYWNHELADMMYWNGHITSAVFLPKMQNHNPIMKNTIQTFTEDYSMKQLVSTLQICQDYERTRKTENCQTGEA